MICLKDSADDVAQSVERDAKRRRIINLSACLWVEATIQQREDVIAELQRELNSIELNPLSPEMRDISGGDRTVAEVSPPPTPELPESACGLGLVS